MFLMLLVLALLFAVGLSCETFNTTEGGLTEGGSTEPGDAEVGAAVGNTSLKRAEKYATIAASLEKEKIENDEMEIASRVGKAQTRDRLPHM